MSGPYIVREIYVSLKYPYEPRTAIVSVTLEQNKAGEIQQVFFHHMVCEV